MCDTHPTHTPNMYTHRGLVLSALLTPIHAACPTSAGDPITTFNGVSTRYWLPEGVETELFRQGDIAVMGSAGRTPGHDLADGEWLHALRLVRGGKTLLAVAVNHSADITTHHNEDKAPPLRALSVQLGGSSMQRGTAQVGNISVSIRIDTRREHPVESLHVTVGDQLQLMIRSSVARKFSDKAEQAKHVHLDLDWTHFSRKEETRGVLPEIWGLAPMSAATKAMLAPPAGRRLDEEDCPSEVETSPSGPNHDPLLHLYANAVHDKVADLVALFDGSPALKDQLVMPLGSTERTTGALAVSPFAAPFVGPLECRCSTGPQTAITCP